MAKQLQLRRGNLSWWTTNNPVLADGEMVLVSTTNDYVYDQYRIGDGLNTFSSLAIHSFPFNTTIEQFLADAEAARDAAQLAETNAETAEANAEAAEALAEKWATNPEDVAVESGKYSALHWSAKAEDEKLAAEAHKNKSQQWAEASENTQVETGKYSALHWAAKAAASAAGIADSAEMLIKHEAEIASLENTLNSANINQETTATATGVDVVALPKTAANTGMQVQMFGQSAENLVTNGDFRNGATGWLILGTPNTMTITDKLTINGTAATSAGYYKDIAATTGNKLYIAIKSTNAGTVFPSVRLYDFNTTNNSAISGINNTVSSVIVDSKINGIRLYFQQIGDAVYNNVTIDDIRVINLTATYGAGNEPTKEQCDVLFANYFEGSDNVLGTGRVRSVGKNKVTQQALDAGVGKNLTTLYSWTDLSTARSIDYIQIDPNTTYRISGLNLNRLRRAYYDKDKVFISGMDGDTNNYTVRNFGPTPSNAKFMRLTIAVGIEPLNVMIERGNTLTATTYEPYRQSILQLTTPELRSNGLIKDEIRKGSNGYELVRRINPSDGTVLTTPTIIPIAHAGLLNSNSNGTVYFEPIIADAGVYSSNLAIQLTDYQISSFESIRKYANGTYTELNTATAVIASGGLSFTHPDLVSGDLVMFTYAYNRESIGRSMTLSYAISNSNPYYNVTNSVPLTTGYYTSTTARAAVPEGIRKTGLILTYETAAGVWYTERYIGTATDTTSWTTAGNWEIGVLRIAAVTDTTEYAEITI